MIYGGEEELIRALVFAISLVEITAAKYDGNAQCATVWQ